MDTKIYCNLFSTFPPTPWIQKSLLWYKLEPWSDSSKAQNNYFFIFIYLFIYFIYFFKLLTVEMSPPHGSNSEFWVREQRWSGKKRHKKYFFTQLTVHTTLTEFFTEVLSCNTDAWLITWQARMITRNVVVYMGRSRIWEKKSFVRQEWQSAKRVTFLLLICMMNKVPGKSSSNYFNHIVRQECNYMYPAYAKWD